MGTKERFTYHSRPIHNKSVNVITGVTISEYYGADEIKLAEKRVGVEQPFHKQMIANRQGATSNLQASRETITYSGGNLTVDEYEQITFPPASITYRKKLVTSSTSGGYTFASVAPKAFVGDAVIKARADAYAKYYSKINEIQRSVQGQVMAGEIRETIRMLRSPFKQGINLLTSMLRSGKTFRGPVKASSDLWLQYRFGILPLMADVEGVFKLINKSAQKEHVGSSRVYGASSVVQVEPWGATPVFGAPLTGTITYEQRAEVIVRFGYLHQAMGASLAKQDDFMKSFLNPRDLPSTAWELIPFSFLVDYFINVGAILESVTTYTGGVVWTSNSTVQTSTATLAISSANSTNASRYIVSSFSPGRCVRTKRSVDRVTAPPGILPLTFELPGSNVRLANIAALLGGLLKGK